MLQRISATLRGRRCQVEYEVLRGDPERAKKVGVFLHCSGSSTKQWRPLAKLCGHHPSQALIAVNLFDSGGSDAPAGLTNDDADLSDQAEAVAEAVQHASSKARLSMVGHSYGGAVAVKAAQMLADRHDAIVLYEANAIQLLSSEAPPAGRVRELWQRMQNHLVAGDDDAFGEMFAAFWFGEGSWAKMSAEAQQRLLHQQKRLDLPVSMLLREGYANGNVNFLRDADCAKHYVRGTVATNPLIVELADELPSRAGFVARTTPTEWGAGHMGPVTHADKVLPLLAELAGLRTATGVPGT